MTFENPDILYFYAIVPLLVAVFVTAERGRRRQLAAMTRPDREGSVAAAGFERRLIFLIFLCSGAAFLVTAAARPQWGTKMEELSARGIDIMLAVDVSESMNAVDVEPSRAAKTRQLIHRLIDLLQGDRVGLIGFAGSAYTFVPLTTDYGAFRIFADTLEPGTVQDPGTDLGSAVEEAIAAYARSGSEADRVLVIFTDGEHHEGDPIPAVERAREEGITTFTIGVGNPGKAGSRIPVSGAANAPDFKVDQQGNLVITRLDEEMLQAVADAGDGGYYRVSDAGNELVAIYRLLEQQQEAEFASRALRLREDRFQIPLLIALGLVTVAYSSGTRTFRHTRRTRGASS